MNRKMKVFAIAAASLLASGLSGGAALAAGSSSPSVSITLSPGTTTCSAAADDTSLGTYTWEGSPGSYVRTAAGKFSVNVTLDEARGASGNSCDVSLYATSDFTYTSDGVMNIIHASDVGLTSEGTQTGLNSPTSLSTSSGSPTTLATAIAAGTYTWDASDLTNFIQAGTQGLPSGDYTTTFVLSSTVSS